MDREVWWAAVQRGHKRPHGRDWAQHSQYSVIEEQFSKFCYIFTFYSNSVTKNRILIAQEIFLMLSDYFTWTGKWSEVAQSCLTLCDSMDSSLHQAPPSMGFSRQEYWSGLPFPSPGNLPTQGSNPGLPHCRQTLYRLSHQGTSKTIYIYELNQVKTCTEKMIRRKYTGCLEWCNFSTSLYFSVLYRLSIMSTQ